MKVLIFSRDPGGANTVIPVAQCLTSLGHDVFLYGKDYALKRYELFGLEGIERRDTSAADMLALLNHVKPHVVVTGTSAQDFGEKYLWKEAQKLGIPSLAILDQWMNYGVRFSKYPVSDLAFYKKNPSHDFLPSKIAVMDEWAFYETVAEGIDPSLVTITGQPYFALIGDFAQKSLNNADYLWPHSAYKIIFVSEPIVQDEGGAIYLGYDQYSIFRNFICALETFKTSHKVPIHIVIKLHPREDEHTFLSWIERLSVKGISFSFDQTTPSWKIVSSCDLVCGMSSMFLLESVLLKKPVISIQIGLRVESPFILDRRGVLPSIFAQEELVAALEKKFLNRDWQDLGFDCGANSLQNILAVINELAERVL